MDVSPKTLREVEFREKMRGYHPDDVDQFLEQVAAGLEVLQDRLRQAVDRAQRAEAAASDAGGNDETLRRTLVLAQRTADLAVQEAREQAARILASAEQQAQAVLGDAEERARRMLDETVAASRAELAKLETSRIQAQQEVDALSRWVEEHRSHLMAALRDALASVDRAGVLSSPPPSRSIDLTGPARPQPSAVTSSPLASPPAGTEAAAATEVTPPGVDTAARHAADEPDAGSGDPYFTGVRSAGDAGARSGDDDRHLEGSPSPEEQALDDFFDDKELDDEDRRFGGRLRRRR